MDEQHTGEPDEFLAWDEEQEQDSSEESSQSDKQEAQQRSGAYLEAWNTWMDKQDEREELLQQERKKSRGKAAADYLKRLAKNPLLILFPPKAEGRRRELGLSRQEEFQQEAAKLAEEFGEDSVFGEWQKWMEGYEDRKLRAWIARKEKKPGQASTDELEEAKDELDEAVEEIDLHATEEGAEYLRSWSGWKKRRDERQRDREAHRWRDRAQIIGQQARRIANNPLLILFPPKHDADRRRVAVPHEQQYREDAAELAAQYGEDSIFGKWSQWLETAEEREINSQQAARHQQAMEKRKKLNQFLQDPITLLKQELKPEDDSGRVMADLERQAIQKMIEESDPAGVKYLAEWQQWREQREELKERLGEKQFEALIEKQRQEPIAEPLEEPKAAPLGEEYDALEEKAFGGGELTRIDFEALDEVWDRWKEDMNVHVEQMIEEQRHEALQRIAQVAQEQLVRVAGAEDLDTFVKEEASRLRDTGSIGLRRFAQWSTRRWTILATLGVTVVSALLLNSYFDLQWGRVHSQYALPSLVQTRLRLIGFAAARPEYPVRLDQAPVLSRSGRTNPLFAAVVPALTAQQAGWIKLGPTQYINPIGHLYVYQSLTGSFEPVDRPMLVEQTEQLQRHGSTMLSASEVAAVPPRFFHYMSPSEVQQFTPTQMALFTPHQVAALARAARRHFSMQQVLAMTEAQYAEVVLDTWKRGATRGGVAVLQLTAIPQLPHRYLTTIKSSDIPRFNVLQLRSFRDRQWLLAPAAHLQQLTFFQLRGLRKSHQDLLRTVRAAELAEEQRVFLEAVHEGNLYIEILEIIDVIDSAD